MLRNTGRNRIGMPVAITPESWSQSDRNAGRNRPEYAFYQSFTIKAIFLLLLTGVADFFRTPVFSFLF
jgi:hypothetical protein